MMINLFAIMAVWISGWAPAVQIILRKIMLEMVCEACHKDDSNKSHDRYQTCWVYDNDGRSHKASQVPRGSVIARTNSDAAFASLFATVWPIIVIVMAVKSTWRGLMWTVRRMTVLTEPERERINRERQQAYAVELQRYATLTEPGKVTDPETPYGRGDVVLMIPFIDD